MNKQSQQGSAHVVIVTVLALALVTALGWIFYQNFIHKEEPVKDTEVVVVDKNKAADKVAEQSIQDGYTAYKDEATGFSFAYPEDWGALTVAKTQRDVYRLGANGKNTKSLADPDGRVRIAIYTLDSFHTRNHAGYVVKYQAGTAMGADAGTETYKPVNPIAGSDGVYADNTGDAGVNVYNLFFKADNSVVYVNTGTKEIQSSVAKTVKVE